MNIFGNVEHITPKHLAWDDNTVNNIRGVQDFGGKPEGKRPMGRPRCRWEDNIKTDLQEVEFGIWSGLGWIRIETGDGHL
jgi:hypothetical protein